jgi:prephenate dehydrogenase
VAVTAPEHDRLVALTSHLAQMSSTALAAVVGDALEFERAAAGAGPGLHDMTRLARSGWDIWEDITSTNTGAIAEALDLYIAELTRLRASLGAAQFQEHFRKGAAFAHRLRSTRQA